MFNFNFSFQICKVHCFGRTTEKSLSTVDWKLVRNFEECQEDETGGAAMEPADGKREGGQYEVHPKDRYQD